MFSPLFPRAFDHDHYHQIQFSDADLVNPNDWGFGDYRPFLFHDHGFVLGIVFADHLQDALDELADSGKLDSFRIDEGEMSEYAEDQPSYLGNEGHPYDIDCISVIELPSIKASFTASFRALHPES